MAAVSDRDPLIFYKRPPCWHLPSLSIACIQVERCPVRPSFCAFTKAYLRFAGLRFEARECAWGSFAPTGQIPAIDNHADILLGCGDSESITQELEGARKIIDHLETKIETSLDNLFEPGERAMLKAFSSLVQLKLIPGLLYSAFCESDAFSKATRPALGSKLAFPLNYWLPYSCQKQVKKALSFHQAEDIYEEACKALHAIACRLKEHKAYFMGDKISSVDAYMFASLAYIHSSPVVHPRLRKSYQKHRCLAEYVNRIALQYFDAPLAISQDLPITWSLNESTSSNSSRPKEVQLQKRGRVWLLGAVAAIVGYVVLSGQYFEVHTWNEFDEDDYDDIDE